MTAKEKNVTILDFDTMMDISMDEVETLPDFVTPPAGLYMLKVEKAEIDQYQPKATKENANPGKATRIKILYSVGQTIETNDTPVKDGALFSESFMGTSEGLAYFKRQSMNIMNVSDLEKATLKDVIEGLTGMEFKAKITIKKTKNPEGGEYENVQVRPIHEPAA